MTIFFLVTANEVKQSISGLPRANALAMTREKAYGDNKKGLYFCLCGIIFYQSLRVGLLVNKLCRLLVLVLNLVGQIYKACQILRGNRAS